MRRLRIINLRQGIFKGFSRTSNILVEIVYKYTQRKRENVNDILSQS